MSQTRCSSVHIWWVELLLSLSACLPLSLSLSLFLHFGRSFSNTQRRHQNTVYSFVVDLFVLAFVFVAIEAIFFYPLCRSFHFALVPVPNVLASHSVCCSFLILYFFSFIFADTFINRSFMCNAADVSWFFFRQSMIAWLWDFFLYRFRSFNRDICLCGLMWLLCCCCRRRRRRRRI